MKESVQVHVCGNQFTVLECHFSPSSIGYWNRTQIIKLAEQILFSSESFCHPNLSKFLFSVKMFSFHTFPFASLLLILNTVTSKKK